MKPKVAVGGDYVELGPGDKVPRLGLAMRGSLVYDDGRMIGVATPTPANAAVCFVLDPRGDYVEIRYLPPREAFKDAA